MRSADVEARWRELGDEVIMGMVEWRGLHPRTTFSDARNVASSPEDRLLTTHRVMGPVQLPWQKIGMATDITC
jgi:hypothetical protein